MNAINTNLQQRNTIEGIQYLRAVAAILVVAYHIKIMMPETHYLHIFNFGYSGVDIFFVISGFVMAYTTQRLVAGETFIDRAMQFLEFFRRRILRIAPLYYVGILWASRSYWLDGTKPPRLIRDMFFIPHPHPVYEDSLRPLLVQGWTLNYEMFFYILFGASMLVGRLRKPVIIATLLLLTIAGLSLRYSHQSFEVWSTRSILTYFYTDSLIFEFLLGILAHRLFVSFKDVDVSKWLLTFAIGLSSLLIIFTTDIDTQTNELYRGFLVGIPAFLIVLLVSKACIGVEIPWLKLLGDASYAIYLFHFFNFGVVVRFSHLIHDALHNSIITAVATLFAFFALSIGSGILIHLYVEKPLYQKIRNLGRRFTSIKASTATAP